MIISLLIRKVLLNKPRRGEDEPDFQEQVMSVVVCSWHSVNWTMATRSRLTPRDFAEVGQLSDSVCVVRHLGHVNCCQVLCQWQYSYMMLYVYKPSFLSSARKISRFGAKQCCFLFPFQAIQDRCEDSDIPLWILCCRWLGCCRRGRAKLQFGVRCHLPKSLVKIPWNSWIQLFSRIDLDLWISRIPRYPSSSKSVQVVSSFRRQAAPVHKWSNRSNRCRCLSALWQSSMFYGAWWPGWKPLGSSSSSSSSWSSWSSCSYNSSSFFCSCGSFGYGSSGARMVWDWERNQFDSVTNHCNHKKSLSVRTKHIQNKRHCVNSCALKQVRWTRRRSWCGWGRYTEKPTEELDISRKHNQYSNTNKH